MIEFKFSCPNCNQHILCNDAYSGMQIVCPTCKNQIVVPPAPGSIPAKPAATIPPPPPVQPQAAAPKAPVPPAKRRYKPRWGMICAAAALIFIGVIAAVVLPIVFSKSEEATKPAVVPKPAVQKTASKEIEPTKPLTSGTSSDSRTTSVAEVSNDSRIPSAAEIIDKVIGKYESLTSYSAKGRAISIIDMSGVDLSKLPGIAGNEAALAKNSEQFKKAMSQPQRTENEFSLKLGRPDFYLVEWQGQMGPMKSKGAVWSAGDGDFLLMDSGKPKYTKMKTREMALAAATGISGGVANTMPQIFFKGQASLLNMFKNPTRGDDETIDGEDCFVINGNAMGLKMIIWVSKKDFLIKQKRQVLGGKLEIPDMDEAKMEEGLKQLGGKPSAAQKTQYKETLKNMKALTSQMKGSMTETYENIEINQSTDKKDFIYDVPAGTPLSDSLF